MSAIMLLTCFTIASAEFIAERSGGDPLGCPYKHVGFVNHNMDSSTFHTWEYVCPKTLGYNVSVVGQFAHCWVDKGVLTDATVLSIPCCNVWSFTKHLPFCGPTAKNSLTCHDFHCKHGTKLKGAESMYIGISDVKHCAGCGVNHRYVPYELCCRKILSKCEAGDHRQPKECMCGNSFPRARCFSSQICKPDGNGKCETGEFEEYVQAVNGAMATTETPTTPATTTTTTTTTATQATCASHQCTGGGFVKDTTKDAEDCASGTCLDAQCCKGSTMSAYVITGIVVGALVLVALLASSFIWCFTRKATGAAAATSQEQLEAV